MPSKNGVFYELKESPYSFMYGDCTFFFSSRKHLSSFMDKICVRTQWLDDSMEKRFHFYVNMRSNCTSRWRPGGATSDWKTVRS